LVIIIGYPFLSSSKIFAYWCLGNLGGLLNSALKRHYQIKDFSNLLGAHGGWLDRADSIYTTAIIQLLILMM
jgi:phosphatidate cytidylyltransferase